MPACHVQSDGVVNIPAIQTFQKASDSVGIELRRVLLPGGDRPVVRVRERQRRRRRLAAFYVSFY